MLPASWSAPDVRRAVVVLAAAGHTALYLSVAPISLADLASTDLIVKLRHPRWAGAWIILLFVGKRFLPTFVTGSPATETSRRQERTQVFKTGVGGFAAVLSMWIALAKTPAAARTLAQVDTPGAPDSSIVAASMALAISFAAALEYFLVAVFLLGSRTLPWRHDHHDHGHGGHDVSFNECVALHRYMILVEISSVMAIVLVREYLDGDEAALGILSGSTD